MSLQVLKDAGVEGMSLGEIMEVSQSRGLKDWEPGAKRILQFVSFLWHSHTAASCCWPAELCVETTWINALSLSCLKAVSVCLCVFARLVLLLPMPSLQAALCYNMCTAGSSKFAMHKRRMLCMADCQSQQAT